MKQFIKSLFNDNNNINEKAVVGFIAFIMMIIVLLTDVISGVLGRELPIHEFVFDGFMMITIGSFGIASVDKWINKTKNNDGVE
jgi:ABC-type uncharacterized transport system permease subunit